MKSVGVDPADTSEIDGMAPYLRVAPRGALLIAGEPPLIKETVVSLAAHGFLPRLLRRAPIAPAPLTATMSKLTGAEPPTASLLSTLMPR